MKLLACLSLLLLSSISCRTADDQICYKATFEREKCDGSRGQLRLPAAAAAPAGSKTSPKLDAIHQANSPQLSHSIEERLAKIEKQLRRISRRSGRNEKEVEQIFLQLETNNLCLAGMKSGHIEDEQISASGRWENKEQFSAKHGRLDSQTGVGAWSSPVFQKGYETWIQVDLKAPVIIYGVVLQGRQSGLPQYVTHFKVQYGLTVEEMVTVTDIGTVFPVIFTGNSDQFSHHTERFQEPITARYFRIVPVNWHGHASMRFDLLTC